MSEHPHVALVRKGYEALARGDMDAMAEIAIEDVAFYIPGDHQFAGDYKGLDGSKEYYRKLGEATRGRFRVELEHVFADGRGKVITVHRTTAERDGRTLRQRRATLFTIVNNRVTTIEVLDEDIDASNHFWA
jgi:ketosteroid isomerase-like protein